MAAVATNLAQSASGIPTYHQIPETKHQREIFPPESFGRNLLLIHVIVDWAQLVTLDLSQFDQPGGKQRLADQLFEAIQKIGEFSRNHGERRLS